MTHVYLGVGLSLSWQQEENTAAMLPSTLGMVVFTFVLLYSVSFYEVVTLLSDSAGEESHLHRLYTIGSRSTVFLWHQFFLNFVNYQFSSFPSTQSSIRPALKHSQLTNHIQSGWAEFLSFSSVSQNAPEWICILIRTR